ncbi:hypothetical protein B0H14DRAFT_2591419 [Mycena olivaceomarginata]|nr:hypothetical protein B0H14DRAFT_2591419 [Mycena olivaceomarginata]
MALPVLGERFTHTPLFRQYPWRSDSFIFDRWEQDAGEVEGLRAFAEFLARLDQLGTSDMPCEIHPVPTGTKQTELLASLSTWPDRFERFQKAWLKHAKKNSPSIRTKARQNLDELGEPDMLGDGSTPDSEAWAL